MIARPVRLQLSRAAGFNLQAHSRATNGLEAVNVARPSMWGNRHFITKGRTREMVVDMYAKDQAPEYIRGELEWLHNKNLACWCPLTDEHGNHVPCHADCLLEISNATYCEEAGL